MSFSKIFLSIFFTLNAVGNAPVIIALISHYSLKKQLFIISREMIIGLAIMLLFGFFGVQFLKFLHIDQSIMGVAGGIILFILALSMMFPKPQSSEAPEHEPFIVPIATPIIVGPGSLAMMAVFFNLSSHFTVISAGVVAWFATAVILLLACFIKKILHTNILLATQRLMGMILTFIAFQMILNALIKYLA